MGSIKRPVASTKQSPLEAPIAPKPIASPGATNQAASGGKGSVRLPTPVANPTKRPPMTGATQQATSPRRAK